MKTKIIISVIWLSLTFGYCVGQATHLGNDINTAPPNPFIGWDNSIPTDALEIRHDAEQPILFSTFGDERMRITEYGNVSIGDVNTVGPKLDVFLHTNNASFGMGAFISRAIQGANRVGGLSDYNVGVFGVSEGGNTPVTHENVGGAFRARNAWRNMAVDAEVSHASPGEATDVLFTNPNFLDSIQIRQKNLIRIFGCRIFAEDFFARTTIFPVEV